MITKDPLLKALIRREAGGRVWLSLAGLVVIALLAAWTSALHPAAVSGPLRWLARFDRTLPILLAVIAGLRLLQRPAEDHSAGWVCAYCGNTGRRTAYAFATVGSVVIVTFVALVVGESAFFAGVLILGRGANPVAPGSNLVMGTLFIVSVSLYGFVIGLLTRDFGAALLIAAIGVALPIAIAVPYALAHDALLPALPRRLIALHLPPLSLDLATVDFARHTLYATVASALLWRIAPVAVARQ